MARNKFDTANINELMGTKVGQKVESSKTMTFDDLPDLLGEKMPELKFNPLGRFRLLGALNQRFGKGFRNIPGVANLVKEFDKEMETEIMIQRIKRSKESQNG